MANKTVKGKYRSLDWWRCKLEQCLQYVTEHGRKPWGKVGTEERTLYDWLYGQTKLYEKEKMPEPKKSDFATLYDLIKKTEKKNVSIKATKKPNSKSSENKWKAKYDRYLKFLSENKQVPSGSSKDKEEEQLASWMTSSRYYLRKGKMLESNRREFEIRLAAMHELLEKVLTLKNKKKIAKNIEKQKKVEAIAIEKAKKKEERKKREEEESAKFNVTFPEHSDQKTTWDLKWQAYMDYMSIYKHRPSKHKAKDLILFDWFKHNKKLLNQGRLQKDRIDKFNQLLEEANRLKRINSYWYADGESYTGKEKSIEIKEEKTKTEKIKEVVKPKQETNEIQLYDYQDEMRQRIETEFKSHRSLMVQMPTGTGKTYLLVAVVMDFLKKNKGYVWIVTHRKELVQQVKETIKKFSSLANDSNYFRKHSNVYSIQWLTRHYNEIDENPGLIVVDEAHHAVAKTYSTVINAFPNAKILGLTATPCRMNGEPFTDLFDELLQSWTLSQFISKGRLSLYDYMSLRPDNADAKKILGLQRRGVDGDFSTREMASKLDVKPSIGRLCDSVLQYAKGKKGIVYAINIQHAEHIAEFYRENGIKAVAISSKTPVKMRDDVVRRFKAAPTDTTELSDKDIQVVVNCDLWGEGFDVPDAEFIQLARPTLSLSKYLQMVGRGLRVFGGKKYCLILDNVGSYRLFGLPSDDRDWEAMFDGRIAGKGDLNNFLTPNEQNLLDKEEKSDTADSQTEMVMLMGHKGLQGDLKENLGYKVIFYKKEKLYGIADANGKTVLPCKYGRINLRPNAIAQLFDVNGKESDWPWIDLITGIRFQLQPEVIRKDWLEITTRDFFKFYPRVKSGWIDRESYTLKDNLDCGVSDGLHFRNFYIQPSEPRKLYKFVERLDDKTLYVDESGRYFVKTDYELPLKEADKEEWDNNKEARNQLIAQAEKIDKRYNAYWDDNRKEVNDASTIQEIGFLKFQVYKEFYRVIMPKWEHKPVSLSDKAFKISWLIRSQIRVYDDICFLGKGHIIMKSRPHVIFNIYKRYVDGRRFDVEFVAYPSERYYCRRLFYDGVNPPVLGNTDIPGPYDMGLED